MGKTSQIKSGGEGYTDREFSDGSHTVRRDDGFLPSTGTKIGETEWKKDSLVLIKSDSGAEDTNIKEG
jgi:hypothetical protein